VLRRAKVVFQILNENSAGKWPSDDEWRRLLPAWFVALCAPERTPEEAQAELSFWRALSPDEKISATQQTKWSVGDWVYWFEPANRQWYWWSGVAKDENTAAVELETLDWPTPFGAFEWLLRCSGAREIDAAD
jgi:hypothetical protein